MFSKLAEKFLFKTEIPKTPKTSNAYKSSTSIPSSFYRAKKCLVLDLYKESQFFDLLQAVFGMPFAEQKTFETFKILTKVDIP